MVKVQLESLLQKKLRLSLQAVIPDKQAYTLKIHGDRFSAPGVPDVLACLDGFFIGIECKMWRGRPSEAQQLHLRDIIRSGGIGLYLIWNKAESSYYWVPADKPFTYRAKGSWIRTHEKEVTLKGINIKVIDCSYIAALIFVKMLEVSNGKANVSSD